MSCAHYYKTYNKRANVFCIISKIILDGCEKISNIIRMNKTKLELVRKESRLHQYELAKISGVSQATISNIENQKYKHPNIMTLKKLARALKIKVNDLI